MFRVNYLSVTIWVLGGILLLIAIGAIIWRVFFDKKGKTITENRNVGSVSKEFNEFIMSLKQTSDFDIIHNILIKNKYSSKNFSMIPAIIFSKGNAFLLTNTISSRKYSKVEFLNDQISPCYVNGNKKIKITNLQKNWTKEILKYLNHKFENVTFNVVTPIIDDQIIVGSKWNEWNYFKAIDFEESIDNFKGKQNISNQDIKKIANHLKSANLFKKSVSLNQKDIVQRRSA